MKPQAQFPELDASGVINSLGAWGISVTAAQLKNPTPELVEGLYCACLSQTTGIDQEALVGPVQNALNHSQVEDRDLYAGPLRTTVMLYHLSRFAKAAMIPDFNSNDLFNPQRERTLFLLSGFINFVKFTEGYCEAFLKDLTQRSHALISERDKVTEQIQDIDTKMGKLKEMIAKDTPILKRLDEENRELRDVLLSSQEFHKKSGATAQQYKTERNELIQRREALHGEIVSIEEAINQTRMRIVQSPERIKRTITTMRDESVDLRRSVAIQEAKNRELQIKISALHNIEKDIRGCIEQLQTIEREVRSLQASEKELSEQKEHLREKVIDKNDALLRKERASDQLKNAEEKLARAQRHAEEKKISHQQTILQLTKEIDQMRVEREENDKQIEKVREEANRVEAMMNEHLKQSETELNELLAAYWSLRRETDVYMETLARKLNMKVIAE